MSDLTSDLSVEEQEVRDEMAIQDAKWGVTDHPDGTSEASFGPNVQHWRGVVHIADSAGLLTWRHLLKEEFLEAIAEEDPERLLAELVQVEAVARQWRMAIRRRLAGEADRG